MLAASRRRRSLRLPLYYRALLETADQEIGTISSERLAEMAGVNAAKVRKDLSLPRAPTAPAASGTTSSTCSTRSPASSASPTTGRSSSSASATSARRSPTTAASARAASASSPLVDADPDKVGQTVGDLDHRVARRSADDRARARASPSASSPRPRDAAQEVADRLVDAGVTSILNFAPTVVSAPDRRVAAQGRPRDRAADPVLLPTAARLGAPALDRRATQRRGRGRGADERDRPARHLRLPGQPRRRRTPLRRGRRRAHRRPQDRRACSRRAPTSTWSPPTSATRCAPGPTPGRLDASTSGRSRPPTSTTPGSPPPPPAIPRSTTRCSRPARPAGCG